MATIRKVLVWRRPRASGAREPVLTPAEQANVKTVIRFLRHQLGQVALAMALGMSRRALKHTTERRRRTSAALALRVARVAGVPLEDVLSGAWRPAGACPMCGRLGT